MRRGRECSVNLGRVLKHFPCTKLCPAWFCTLFQTTQQSTLLYHRLAIFHSETYNHLDLNLVFLILKCRSPFANNICRGMPVQLVTCKIVRLPPLIVHMMILFAYYFAFLTEFSIWAAPRMCPSVSFVLVHLGVLSYLLFIFLQERLFMYFNWNPIKFKKWIQHTRTNSLECHFWDSTSVIEPRIKIPVVH